MRQLLVLQNTRVWFIHNCQAGRWDIIWAVISACFLAHSMRNSKYSRTGLRRLIVMKPLILKSCYHVIDEIICDIFHTLAKVSHSQ